VALGIYISVPFCRTKCSYCNFASDVFSKAVFEKYVGRVCADINDAQQIACAMGGRFEHEADSIYLGGGTPTVLEAAQLRRIFDGIRATFSIVPGAEITVECAPGTLSTECLDGLLACGVNRVSLGVQSFIDAEASAVGRLHKRATVFDDITRLRNAGIRNINVDLIAGLPHQTAESWMQSVHETITTGVPHASVYMLEVDEDSRLGREVIAGGARYHAHFVPDDEAIADFYRMASESLEAAGISQYEISNFSRAGFESHHNLKYWTRQPYFGFGVDAHSMLKLKATQDAHGASGARINCMDAVRLSAADSLEKFVAGSPLNKTPVSFDEALEESFFLGLRLNRGVDLRTIAEQFGADALPEVDAAVIQLVEDGLLQRDGTCIRLTSRGRLLSNEVFQRFIGLGHCLVKS
jgi:oxygen-independent coproporphyrinogen-3 oxidase